VAAPRKNHFFFFNQFITSCGTRIAHERAQPPTLKEPNMKRIEVSPGFYDMAIAFLCMGMTFGLILQSTF
jgi:hypothetical protein